MSADATLIAAAALVREALEYAEAQLAYSDEHAHLINAERADALHLVRSALEATRGS